MIFPRTDPVRHCSQAPGQTSAGGGLSAVATASPLATKAAMDVLHCGGNAADAAAAAAWTLCVCEPSGSGLGGQTTALVRLRTGRIHLIDGHSHAPRRVSRTRVSSAQQTTGVRACTIPSTAAALDYLVRRFGRLQPAMVIRPAARLADEGFEATRLYARQMAWTAHLLARDADTGRMFLHDGRPPQAGQRVRFPELAATLHALATDGATDFYHGRIAAAIAADMRARGGLLDERDLADFSGPTERDPLMAPYGHHLFWTAPSPGGGHTLLRALQLSAVMGLAVPDRYERRALATWRAFAEREGSHRHMAPAPYPASGAINAAEGPGETTHLSIADEEGNVVCLTQSIQSLFGAKVANAKLGFFYNNYLVTCPRRPHPARLGSCCVPRSNVAPSLISTATPDHLPVLALGGAGSRRIISSMLGAIEDVLVRGLSVAAALAEPRVHGLLSGEVWIERPAASGRRLDRLATRFAAVAVKRRHDYSMGCVQAIHWPGGGHVDAAADPRREGTAAVVEGRGACHD